MKIVKKTVLITLILIILNIIPILYVGLNDDVKISDVALVLGNKVNRDGSLSDRLKSRLDKSIELYKAEYYNKIIVSGGLGKEGHDEAVVMKDYLLKQGIASNDIIVDSKGTNTYLSSLNTDSIMTTNNWSSVLVISNFYHIRRSKLALSNRGIEHLYSAHADYYELRDIYSILREIPAWYFYLWK